MQDLQDSGYDLREHTERRDSAKEVVQSSNKASSDEGTNTEPVVEQAVKQKSLSPQQAGDVTSVRENLPHVLLVVAVVSARPDRRNAIRKSWLAWGDERVQLRFFTEAPIESDPNFRSTSAALRAESDAHGDLVFMDIDTGMNFALKLLWAMRWMSQRFTFDFFLRLDDDYFLCLRRLLDELDATLTTAAAEDAPALAFMAGHRYCEIAGRERIDEAYLLLSEELVDRVLSASDLQCGGHAGVTVAWWFTKGQLLNTLGDVQWVGDPRLDHVGDFFLDDAPPRHRHYDVRHYADVCVTHMGVHHAYPDSIAKLWEFAKEKSGPGPDDIIGNSADHGPLLLRYVDDGSCRGMAHRGIGKGYFELDHPQPCDTFVAENVAIHCGAEGC